MSVRWLSDIVALAQASRLTIGYHAVLRSQQADRLIKIAQKQVKATVNSSGYAEHTVSKHTAEDSLTSFPSLHVAHGRSKEAIREETGISKGRQVGDNRYSVDPNEAFVFDPHLPTRILSTRQREVSAGSLLDGASNAPSVGQYTQTSRARAQDDLPPALKAGKVQLETGPYISSEAAIKDNQDSDTHASSEDRLETSKKLGEDLQPASTLPSEATSPRVASSSQSKADFTSTSIQDKKRVVDETSGPHEDMEQFVGNSEVAHQIFYSRGMREAILGRRGNHFRPPKAVQGNAEAGLLKDKSMSTGSHENAQFEEAVSQPETQETNDIARSASEVFIDRVDQYADAATGSSRMKESRVPSSRLSRIWQYAGLGASLTLGAATESLRRISGATAAADGSAFLNVANVEKVVARLSRMRGAALKMGQMLSFQDSKVLPPLINQILQRVQDSADFMPSWQRDRVLATSLGTDWRDIFSEFEEFPLAAASIGQVHAATLKSNNQPVAVKIQYPGVADSIDSDLKNLSMMLTASRLLPKGLYLDKTIANARSELAWECDYIREAEAAKTFKSLLSDESHVFSVPKVYDEACGAQVLTMQRMRGTAVAKSHGLSQEQRNWIGNHVLRLCLREITEFKYMQTDPNWTNFLFNPNERKIELLDFGASRKYTDDFIIPYVQLLYAASIVDYEKCKELSIRLGYLTGMESKVMLDAHIQSIMILAEPFRASAPSVYDFENQTVTQRVRALIPVMLKERLSPPPEETYSLHRKLSGAFLLLAKLGSKVDTKTMFAVAIEKSRIPVK